MSTKQQVMALVQNGQWTEAKSLCAQLCHTSQSDAEAWFLLGAINGQLGDFDEAVACCRRVVSIRPDVPIAHYNLGVALQKRGMRDEALESFQTAIRLKPDFAEAHLELGNMLQFSGRLEAAVEHYRRSLALNSGIAAVHYNLGAALKGLGRIEDAAESCRRALAINPGLVEAHHMLGLLLKEQGKPAQSQLRFEQVLRAQPDNGEACFELGEVLRAQGKKDEVIARYRRAVQISPENVGWQNTLGLALIEQSQFAEAEACFRKAVGLQPDSAEAHNNLASALMMQGKIDEAVRHYQIAIERNPTGADTYINMGVALLQKRGNIGEAIKLYQAALQRNPDHAELYSSLGTLQQIVGRLDLAMESYQQALRIKPGLMIAQRNLATLLNYHSSAEPAEVFARHAQCGQAYAQAVTPVQLNINDRDPGRRLRIGYVSPDLRSHSVAYFFEPLLRFHDKDIVETICYSDVQSPDDMTARLMSLAGKWRNIYNVADAHVVDMVVEDKIDILIDLAGYTANNRLPVFARKPAPIQVTYLGYPNTTGLPTMDYRFTDEWADPAGTTERYHTETLIRLPHGFLCYQPPAETPSPSLLPALSKGYVTFGSFNNLSKVTPEVVAAWAKILSAVRDSRMIMKADGLADANTREYYNGLFNDHGIARERIDLLGTLPSLKEHLAVYGHVDIALDPFPYNGTTTTCEAMWMGVPVITLAGRTHAGRVGVSLLARVGLNEYIAGDPEEYFAIASRLAGDKERLAELRTSLRSRMTGSSLCDPRTFARDVEAEYRHIWMTWCDRSR
jgi:protein O-GlcNAc transferase